MTTERAFRRPLRRAMLLVAVLAQLGLAGCRKFTPAPPAGFAAYDERLPYRAVSPDGVTYRIRQEDNEPVAQLPFWREALKKRMADAGYGFISERDLKAGGDPGYLLELSAPLGQQDNAYLVGLFVREKTLVIVESSGEVTKFKAREPAIIEAIEAIRF